MTNGLRNFDVKANQFSLNMAKLSLEHGADPVGFRVDFGFGRAFDIIQPDVHEIWNDLCYKGLIV